MTYGRVARLQQSIDHRSENRFASRFDVVSGSGSTPRLVELDDTADPMPGNSQQLVADEFGNAIVIWIQNDGALKN